MKKSTKVREYYWTKKGFDYRLYSRDGYVFVNGWKKRIMRPSDEQDWKQQRESSSAVLAVIRLAANLIASRNPHEHF